MPMKKPVASKRPAKPKKKPAKPRSYVQVRLPGKGKIPLKAIRAAVLKVREMELAGLIPGVPIPPPDLIGIRNPGPGNGAKP